MQDTFAQPVWHQNIGVELFPGERSRRSCHQQSPEDENTRPEPKTPKRTRHDQQARQEGDFPSSGAVGPSLQASTRSLPLDLWRSYGLQTCAVKNRLEPFSVTSIEAAPLHPQLFFLKKKAQLGWRCWESGSPGWMCPTQSLRPRQGPQAARDWQNEVVALCDSALGSLLAAQGMVEKLPCKWALAWAHSTAARSRCPSCRRRPRPKRR